MLKVVALKNNPCINQNFNSTSIAVIASRLATKWTTCGFPEVLHQSDKSAVKIPVTIQVMH
jgi:hypothetical protein